MGYMTVISILNDGWELIEENPKEFIDAIYNGMSPLGEKSPISYHSIKGFSAPVAVSRSMHADTPQLVMAHCNSMTALHEPDAYMRDDNDYSNFVSDLFLAQNVIDYSKRVAEEKAFSEVLRDISEAGKDVTTMTKEEIQLYVKKNRYAQQINWKVNLSNQIWKSTRK